MNSWATTSLSRKVLIGTFVLAALYFFGLLGGVEGYLVLAPSLIFPRFELWRLLSYPLAAGFLDLLIAMICFGVPGEELEQMVGTGRFGLLLLLLTLGIGVLHSLLFFGSPTSAPVWTRQPGTLRSRRIRLPLPGKTRSD